MEDGSGQRKDVVAAYGAGVAGATRYAVVLAFYIALDAQRHTAGPPFVQHVLKAGVVIGKVCLELFGGVFLLGRDGLAAVHGLSFRVVH